MKSNSLNAFSDAPSLLLLDSSSFLVAQILFTAIFPW